MKVHITNIYNFNKEDSYVEKQHKFAKAGCVLGFLEMGIFNYPVETDSERELSIRLDGVIASLEFGDTVFMQLPTGNGYVYEQSLINKIKAYKNTKLVIVLHNMEFIENKMDVELKSKYLSLYKIADMLIVPSVRYSNILKSQGLNNILFYDNISIADSVSKTNVDFEDNNAYLSLCQSDFYIKKLYMDAIEKLFVPSSIQYESKSKILDDEVHIGFGLHDRTGNYSIWVGVAMQSVIEHTGAKICFHILHDDTLGKDNREKLITVATSGGHRIVFHCLDKKDFEHLSEQMQNYTIGAMFRIMLPEILGDLSKIIYLDADLLVNRDIKELWDTDIEEYCLAAVPDSQVVEGMVIPMPVKCGEVSRERYFNSGVLYLNLDKIRATGSMYKKIMEYLEGASSSDLPDQDALNSIYNQETLLLDGSWNYFSKRDHIKGERRVLPRIYHYVGTRPLLYCHTEMDELYFETTSRTPWGIEGCKSQLRKAMERTTDRISQFEKFIHQIASEKTKYIYYGEENSALKVMYELLSIREGDYRVLSEPKQDKNSVLPCKPLSILKNEEEPYVVLVLPDADEGKAVENLEKMGMKNGIDFFNIRRLLWAYDGGYA